MAEISGPRDSTALVVFITGTVLSTLAVGIRVYSRRILLHSFGKDDAVMLGGWAFLIATAVAMSLEYHFGMGKHISDVPEEDILPYMKAFLVSTVVYSIAIYLVKISIMLQYCRIFQATRFYRFYFCIMLGLSIWTILMTFLLTFICVPISHFWDPNGPGGCMNKLALWLSIAVINMVTDLTCFAIPIPPLLKLRMAKNEKIILAGIFGLALCPCVISAYRITTLLSVADSTDSTYDNAHTAIWSFLELSIGTIAACMPTFRPVLSKILPRVLMISSRSGTTKAEELRYQRGISVQLTSHTNTNTQGFKKDKDGSESTRELGLSEHDGNSTWDRDETSLNHSSDDVRSLQSRRV
ncbi:putative Integral membrane protein [Seiridium cardinale]|uniref:Integral membrane protein n=1 Tax=Seiridium cardinale TaxID=138064 RepID=A0ABR2XCZ7_9PEZI